MTINRVVLYPQTVSCHTHLHDNWEIALNRKGKGYIMVEDEVYPYKEGTITCTPPNVPHSKHTKSSYGDVCIYASSFVLGRDKTNKVYIFQDDTEKSIETLINMTHRIYQKNDSNAENILDSLYRSIEHILLSWYQHSPKNVEVEKLLDKLNNQFNDPELSINKIISESVYCGDHLRRIFKNETGMTPGLYLSDLRINYAQRLLKENKSLNYSINDICLMSGFYDSRYFSRIFKKKTNKTPSEFVRDYS